MDEIWKDIEGYEGLYQVSNLGRIKSVKRTKPNGYQIKVRFLKPSIDKDGYSRVVLSRDGESTTYQVHRLVAFAFVRKEHQKPEVNHIDENKSNNEDSNLEWCTRKENINHGTAIQRSSNKNKKPINQLSSDGQFIKAWESISDAAETLGFSQGYLSKCCSRKCSSAYVYLWEFREKFNEREERI